MIHCPWGPNEEMHESTPPLRKLPLLKMERGNFRKSFRERSVGPEGGAELKKKDPGSSLIGN